MKLKPDETVDKYKARLVAKGFHQKHGEDYNDAKYKSIRILLALAALHGWKVYHDDVRSAFLNGGMS